jgi:hypothetical protein
MTTTSSLRLWPASEREGKGTGVRLQTGRQASQRPVANAEPHTEGAGDQEAIVFFSNRNVEGDMYEFLDDDLKQVQMLGIADFKVQLDDEVASGVAAKVATRTVASGVAS